MPRLGPISTAHLTKVARADWDRVVAEIAACQHGVVTRAQLLAIGMTSGAIRDRRAAGRLHLIHRGVYAVGYRPTGAHANWIAAVLACGPDAVLSHASAAALWEIRPSSASRIDVASGARNGRGRPGIRPHSGACLPPSQCDIVNGIPCTTVARTIIDLAAVLAPGALEYAIHRAQTMRKFDREDVLAALESAPTRPGTAAVRRVLGVSAPAEDAINSLLEKWLFRICRRFALPEPEVNRWMAIPGTHGFEVDFCWPDRRLIVETDSRTHHDTDRAFENDPHRDRLLMLAGWRVARFTYRDVTERPDEVASQLRRLLAR